MTSLDITEDKIPDLSEKTAVVTGGASGIGLGAVEVLLDHNARVFVLDVSPLPENINSEKLTYIETDISSWPSLVDAFAFITATHNCQIDIAIGNAGVGEFELNAYLAQCLTPAPSDDSAWSKLKEEGAPVQKCIEVNFKGTVNFVLLAARVMKRQPSGGSIVLTTSGTAYLPEQMLPIYSATKGALVNLVRALRPTLPLHNISINAVAPSGTKTAMLPAEVTETLESLGLPISTSRHVGLALVYSATAMQTRRVEDYGKDQPTADSYKAKWNGRVIHTIGSNYYEVEEKLAEMKPLWWGEDNIVFSKKQQLITDTREI